MSSPLDLGSLLAPLQDYDFRALPERDLRQASVLIPIVQQHNRLLYTLRSNKLKKHPGQISFPGGVIEKGEEPLRAALREAHEEIGLEPDQVVPLGRIDDAYSPRGFHIRCYVGLCQPFEPIINTHEVEKVLQVDLHELLDHSLHEVRPFMSRKRVHYFNFQQGRVWGVTGYITQRLRKVLESG